MNASGLETTSIGSSERPFLWTTALTLWIKWGGVGTYNFFFLPEVGILYHCRGVKVGAQAQGE